MKTISERISYIPASENPLSADIGFVHGNKYEWIIDVGSSSKAVDVIQRIDREKKIILSHFHKDHTANIEQIQYDELYAGSFICKKVQNDTAVREALHFEDGIKLTIFPIPSIHSKGAVGLEVDEKFAFLGDATYGAIKNGKPVKNVSLLRETILALEALKADKFLISHNRSFIKDKSEVISELEDLYQKWTMNNDI